MDHRQEGRHCALLLHCTAYRPERMRLRPRLFDEICCCFNCSLKAAVLRKYRSWTTRRHGGSEKNMCGARGGTLFPVRAVNYYCWQNAERSSEEQRSNCFFVMMTSGSCSSVSVVHLSTWELTLKSEFRLQGQNNWSSHKHAFI